MSTYSQDNSLPALLTVSTPGPRNTSRSRIGQRRQHNSGNKNFSSPSGYESRILSPSVRVSESQDLAKTMLSLSTTHFETMLEETMNTDLSRAMTNEDDIEEISDKVFGDFHGFYRCYVSENEVFELLESYEQVCSDFVTIMSRSAHLAPPNRPSQSQYLQDLLIMERNTWRLARILYQDRLTHDDLDASMDAQGSRFHDAQIIENLYKRDSEVRQCQLVLDWLEKNEAESISDPKSKCIVDSKVAWENTFHALQRKAKNPSQVHMRPMVTKLDPDAPCRQDAPLHDLDRTDEHELFGELFCFIRRGCLDKAQQLAEQCGYFWFSAALDGWRLHKDPNYNLPSTVTLNATEGNPCRDIWKAHCWNIIDRECLDIYESAIYASLSGNLKGLMPICRTWEDALWAQVKVLLDSKIDEELLMSSQMKRPRVDLPHPSWNQICNLEQIFHELKAGASKEIRDQCDTPHHTIQRHIVLDSVNDIIEEMHKLVTRTAGLSHHLTRFFAHFVLFLRLVGLSTRESCCVDILQAFVQVLIKDKKIDLIATYTATLPPEDQIITYAKFLEGISEHSERQKCLELAEEAGLQIQKLTKTVVENIRNRQDLDLSGQSLQLVSETTQEDLIKIEALDWLSFIPEQRAEAMKQANALMRVFIASQKMDAAEKAMNRLPADSIAVITRQLKHMTGGQEFASEEDSICREYLCFQAYMQALEAFNDWFRIFHQRKPVEPIKPEGESTKFMDWVAFEHKTKQFDVDMERWKQSVLATTKVATDRLYNVLLFPDGGWMVDKITIPNKTQEDSCREQQMSRLRNLCIPHVCSLLHKVLHDSSHFQKALEISDVIASEKNRLYMEFSKEEMRMFLLKLRESSLELLDQNLDPLGYPLQ